MNPVSKACATADDAVRVVGVSKSFDGVTTLDRVDLSVRPGEIHALLGENGAGKTTLLEIICGLQSADNGRIDIGGGPTLVGASEELRRQRTAMVSARSTLVPTLTVAQNLFLNQEPRTRFGFLNEREMMSRSADLLRSFDVPLDASTPAFRLTEGQRQLVEILRAVARRSVCLLLDEPTSKLSEAEAERLFSALRLLRERGAAVVYVSHRVDQIMRLCNRASVLRDGRRVITASLSDLTIEALVEYVVGRHGPGLADALIESEDRFQRLAASINEVFWMVDAVTDKILYVSPAYEHIWGSSRESLNGTASKVLETVHREDLDRVSAAYREKHESQSFLELEYRIVRPDDAVRWIRDRSFPMRQGSGQNPRIVRITEDITERILARQELEGSFSQLRALMSKVQGVREEERTRVSREIHDELGQALTGIKLCLSSWSLQLREPESRQRAEPILEMIDESIRSVRRISTELRPGILDDMGLLAAVEWAAEEFESRSGTRCELDLPKDDIDLDPERATALFRIFQETLTNIARHAKATLVEIRMMWDEETVSLNVTDNGIGFDPTTISAVRSLGILGMKERALLLGGKLKIEGEPGKGTSVTVRIPINSLAPQ